MGWSEISLTFQWCMPSTPPYQQICIEIEIFPEFFFLSVYLPSRQLAAEQWAHETSEGKFRDLSLISVTTQDDVQIGKIPIFYYSNIPTLFTCIFTDHVGSCLVI